MQQTQMPKWKTTPISVSVHLENESPIFGECATHISVDDEGAGTFICLKQVHDDIEKGMVNIGIEELELIFKAAKELISKYS